MELWVRSQDKNNLKKVNNIYVEHITKDYDSWVGNIHCQPYVITSDNGNLGFYGTKERALEVLDEIQNSILGILSLEDIEKQEIKKYTGKATFSKVTKQLVYIMPEE